MKKILFIAALAFASPVSAQNTVFSADNGVVDFNKPIQYYHDGIKYNLLCEKPKEGQKVIDEKGQVTYKDFKCKILSEEKDVRN